MNQKEKKSLLERFAKYLDDGFNLEEPLAVNYVDDFLMVDISNPRNSCQHKNSVYLGDGDYQCKDCFVIY